MQTKSKDNFYTTRHEPSNLTIVKDETMKEATTDKTSRAQMLLARARQRKEDEAYEIQDSIEDYSEAVFEGKKTIKTVPPSVTNSELMPAPQQKQYSAALEKAIELLGRRVPSSVVASATGLSLSYLHEMVQDEHFMGRIVALQTEKLKEATDRDNKYNRLEDLLLDRLTMQVPGMFDPVKTANVLKIVNSAIRRGAGENNPAEQIGAGQVVNLSIPAHLLNMFDRGKQEIVLNENKEVIAVGDTRLGRMDSTNLLNIAEAELVKDKVIEDAKDITIDELSSMDKDELRSLL